MKVIPRRCECVWCCQIFYSSDYYKFGTCSSCLLFKEVLSVPRLAELLRQAEDEARSQIKG